MSTDRLKDELTQEFLRTDPAKLSGALLALWHEGHGDWKRSHEVAQDGGDSESSWVHAYLHRKEGDFWNAEYWYRRAGKPVFRGDLKEEWKSIVQSLLSDA